MSSIDPGPDHARASDEVGRAVIALIREEPFFGHLLSGINRKITSDVSRSRVTFRAGRPLLEVNPEFLLHELTDTSQRSAVVKQNILSLLLNHGSRFDPVSMDSQIFQMASDLVINQLVGDRWPLPPGSIELDSFAFPLPEDMTLEWYYGELTEHREEIPEEMVPDPSGLDQPRDGSDQADAIGEHELAKALRDARDRTGEQMDQLPAQIEVLVESLIDELQPTVDWRRVIRLFANSSRRTRISNTLRRPSKRYGTYPGIKVKRLHRFAVVIDTSGSVNQDAFSDFFTEVHAIWRQGSLITIIEADSAVRKTWDYHGTMPPKARGRGGTSFNPALQWITDASPGYDAALYFTDGKAPAPTVRPPCEVLWVLPHDGDPIALAGRRIITLSA